MRPSISVIVPCYNQARYLPFAIQSLLDQSMPEWEAIIVNDGSPDNTEEVARHFTKLDNRIKYIEQKNKGLSAARNAGARVATGRYLQFLDADDILEIHKLHNHVTYLENNPDIDVAYGDARYFHDDNPTVLEYDFNCKLSSAWIPELWHAPGTILDKFLQRNLLPVNTAIIRSDVFNRVGFWNESLQALEDWEFWTRCAGLGVRFHYIDGDQSMALIRLHPTSMTRDTMRIERAYREMLVVLGEAVQNTTLRSANFRRGCQLGADMSASEFRRYIKRLAKANWTVLVGVMSIPILARLYARHAALMCLRAYRTIVPWPLQKAINSLLRRKH